MAKEKTRFPGLDPLEDYTPSQSQSLASFPVTQSHSTPSSGVSSPLGDLIDLSTSGRDSPLVSSVQRKILTAEGQATSPAHRATSSPAKSRLNISGGGYTPGAYSQSRVKSSGGSSSYVPGSYTKQRKQRATPTPPKPKENSDLTADVEASATASSLVSFDMPLYMSARPSEPLAAEPAVTVFKPFSLPPPAATPNLSEPSAMHVANPAATFDDPTNFDAMEALMKKLAVQGSDSHNGSTEESDVVQPSQLPKKILASAGVQVDLDSLEPTHDGKAPLELVGNFLACVMNQKFEAALVLCQYVLRFEPDNETAREFYPLIIEKIHHGIADEMKEDFATLTNTTSTPSNSTVISQATEAPDEERLGGLTIFFILLLLLIAILLVYSLIKAKFHYLPESIACVLLGAIVGLLLKVLPIGDWEAEEAFPPTIFFLVLLPPIIFESGYSLHKGNFFQNIGSILLFAVLGTAISAMIIGGFIYILGQAGVIYRLSTIESFAFGSLISAVDPVATLALFQALDVDPILYMLVFGESVLNDAVSIVMTNSILAFRESSGASATGVFAAIGHFLLMFLGSSAIGVVFALVSAWLLKHINLRSIPSLELGTVIIFAYSPYALAEALRLSGIMAILFCGIVMSHYTHFNLSPSSQITVQLAFRTIAFLSETCVFAYIGLAIFSFHHEFKISLILWSIFLILLGRAVNIFPLSLLANRCRSVQISFQNQVVIWFSGLRGAIAFALSLHLPFEKETRAVLITTTLIIVLVTVVILGGAILPLLKVLRSHYADKLTMSKTKDQGVAIDTDDLERTEGLSGGLFSNVDKKYIIPFFRRRFTQQEVRDCQMEMQRMTSQWYDGVAQVPTSEDEVLPTEETLGGSDNMREDTL